MPSFIYSVDFNFETVVGISAVIFSLVSIILILRALRRISPGVMKNALNYVALAVVILAVDIFYHTIREIYDLKEIYGPIVEMPEYLFVFLMAAFGLFATVKISNTFGTR